MRDKDRAIQVAFTETPQEGKRGICSVNGREVEENLAARKISTAVEIRRRRKHATATISDNPCPLRLQVQARRRRTDVPCVRRDRSKDMMRSLFGREWRKGEHNWHSPPTLMYSLSRSGRGTSKECRACHVARVSPSSARAHDGRPGEDPRQIPVAPPIQSSDDGATGPSPASSLPEPRTAGRSHAPSASRTPTTPGGQSSAAKLLQPLLPIVIMQDLIDRRGCKAARSSS